MSPSILDSVLRSLPKQTNPNVLVGFDTADDAGVYQLAPDLALVQTVDFFTPIVDDPYTFGQVAATNALSDVYAMGGRPISALSIVGFPNTGRDTDVLERILQGGLSKMQEAGCAVIGGHSIGDEEIKFGYAVTGLVNPQRLWKNATARAGDRLVLTKRLGTGVISTALKKGRASVAAVDAATESMTTLNGQASEIAQRFEIHAATDITGFGLLGHAREMAVGSQVSLVIDSSRVAFLPEAIHYARDGFMPGGLHRNREFIAGCAEFSADVPEDVRNLLFDPQTAGGLLFSVAAEDGTELTRALREADVHCDEIGKVISKTDPLMRVQ
ncbi:MAG TPA: selenide, water dikinase SelD [Terriglobia bacterium]|nr:selenide, water dikinase SelD [Terriglobia bacterium]